MTNRIDLSSIFDVYSMRDRPMDPSGKDLTREFKNRVWLFCQEMVHPYDHYSRAGYKIADYWMTLRDKLRYQHGLEHLADKDRYNPVTEVEKFLSDCSDEHYLDFIEMFFHSEKLPMHFSDGELEDAVNNINNFFDLDDLPYALTKFLISGSRTLKPRINRLLSRLRPRPGRSEPTIMSSHMQPPSLPIRIAKVEAYPLVIRRESEVVHQSAIKPALDLLSASTFGEASREFRNALVDYRQGDYQDCLTKCGSAYESVMKVICEQKDWPPQRDAAKLLDNILSRTNLPRFLRQPLIQAAVIRNELGSAHGAGTEPREVTAHLAQYAINVTASAILLLVEETKS